MMAAGFPAPVAPDHTTISQQGLPPIRLAVKEDAAFTSVSFCKIGGNASNN